MIVLGRDVRRGEERRDFGVVLAVVLRPPAGEVPVRHAGLDDVGEVVVVGADPQCDQRDVVRGGVLLERLGLADVAVAVGVEVDAGLEVAVRVVRRRAGPAEIGPGARWKEDLPPRPAAY